MTYRILGVVLIGLLAGCTASRTASSLNLSPSKKYYVVLMGGQSNMVGLGRTNELDTASTPNNIHYLNFGMSPDFSQDSLSFGPEVGLSRVLHQHFPDSSFMLIKYAIGGASLLDWAPEYDSAQAVVTGHSQFGNMYDSLWTRVGHATAEYDTEIIALLWMQGERDARVPEAGVDYYSHFKAFIEAIRQDTRPDLPVIFGLVNPDPTRYAALDTVQAAQKQIVRDTDRVWMIDTSDLEKWEDQVHYDTAGQLELGTRFGQALLKAWSAP